MAIYGGFKIFKNNFTVFQDFFRFPLNLYKCLGFRIDDSLSNHKCSNNIFFTLCVIFKVLYCLSNCTYLITIKGKIEDKLSTLLTLLSSVEVLIKIINLNRSSKQIRTILESLKEMTDLQNDDTDWTKEANIILNYTKVTIYSAAFFFFVPILITIKKYLSDLKWEPMYVNQLWYPFDEQDPMFYVPACVFHLIHGVIFMFYFAATDSLVLMIMIHINQQFNLIAEKMSAIRNSEDEMKQLVEKHCRATKYIKKLNFLMKM